jgi:hypothetical protein
MAICAVRRIIGNQNPDMRERLNWRSSKRQRYTGQHIGMRARNIRYSADPSVGRPPGHVCSSIQITWFGATRGDHLGDRITDHWAGLHGELVKH